uniref:Endonuclease/exonuclease/phosphatase family protein n=1 Tax=Elysia chlorotica TaxID=188477 RepID=A0A1S5V2N0_ELYCH|nr:endonuclease/exonuclease/phosphatase family protein [Elysia chlorotica]
MNKRNELKAMIDLHQPSIIGITEVKPKNARYNIHDSELSLPGFDMFHNLDENGRGIVLYVRSKWKPSICEGLKSNFNEKVVVESMEEEGNKLVIGLVVVYRSPSCTKENTEKLNELLQEVAGLEANHLLIIGDFNFPQVIWNEERCEVAPNHAASVSQSNKRCFLDPTPEGTHKTQNRREIEHSGPGFHQQGGHDRRNTDSSRSREE